MAIAKHRGSWSAHYSLLAAIGLSFALVIPVALTITGIALRGWGGIDWGGAIAGGVAGTWAFTILDLLSKQSGVTRVDLLDLLGSVLARPGTRTSRALGLVMNSGNGALLGIAWAFGARLAGVTPGWASGLVGGLALWVLALLAMSCAGLVHPAIRRGAQADPGPLALELGQLMPLVSFFGHAVYGIVLGAVYAAWPL